MPRCLIEETAATAMVTQPIRQQWGEFECDFELVPRLNAETITEIDACAIVGSIDAALLQDRYLVAIDLAFVSHHSGPVALWTASRPDEVDDAVVALGATSRTAEAMARATIGTFYGISVREWDRGADQGDVAVLEGAEALRQPESGQLNDLARAWFILSGFPIPTHVVVAPKHWINQQPHALETVIRDLQSARAIGEERRREIRRNLAEELALDRDRLVEFQADQTMTFSKTVRKGWLDLVRRTARAMDLPKLEPTFVSVLEKAR